MRKITLLLICLSLITAGLFSCKSSNTPPTFNFKRGLNYVFTNDTVNNTSVKIGIDAKKAASKLSSLEITHVDINGVSHKDTVIAITDAKLQKEFTYDFIIAPPSPYATGSATWTFKIKDMNGNSISRPIIITYI